MNLISKQSSLKRPHPLALMQVSIEEFYLSPIQFSSLIDFNNIKYIINNIKVNKKIKIIFRDGAGCHGSLLLCCYTAHEHLLMAYIYPHTIKRRYSFLGISPLCCIIYKNLSYQGAFKNGVVVV